MEEKINHATLLQKIRPGQGGDTVARIVGLGGQLASCRIAAGGKISGLRFGSAQSRSVTAQWRNELSVVGGGRERVHGGARD